MILVTGGNGFLASHIIPVLLKNNYHVRATRRANSDMRLCKAYESKVEWITADVTDMNGMYQAMENVDEIIHSAAVVSFDTRDNDMLYNVNVQGTANVMNAALEHKIKYTIHISSVAALGRAENKYNISEENKWTESKLNYNYAISKYLSEMEVWRAMNEGLPAVILNPSIILGNGDWQNGTSAMFRKVDNGLLFYPPGGSGFVSAKDIAEACILLLNKKVINERYILNAENMSFYDFFSEIAQALNVREPYIKANKVLATLYADWETLTARMRNTKPSVTRESLKTLGDNLFYNNQKFVNQFHFSYTPIKTIIHEVADAYCKSQKQEKP